MSDRKEKIKEWLESLHSIKSMMVFKTGCSIKMPRITPSQWGVLMTIEQRKESTLKDVAGTLGITSSATTQLVDGLVASGYLEKKTYAKDRRAVILTLSKKTAVQVSTMKKQGLEKFIKIFEALNDAEFNQYIALSKKIVEKSLSEKKISTPVGVKHY